MSRHDGHGYHFRSFGCRSSYDPGDQGAVYAFTFPKQYLLVRQAVNTAHTDLMEPVGIIRQRALYLSHF